MPGPGQLAPAEGRLLVATPVIDEPTFFRTVVLLLEHDDEVGTLGVVLNRPTGLTVAATLPRWAEAVSDPPVLFDGGPVAEGSALALAALAGPVPEGSGLTSVYGPLAVVDLESDPAGLPPTLARLRIYSGYAGWGPGQLRGELRGQAWWVIDSQPSDWFTTDPDALWGEVLARQGGPWKMWATAPVDPTVN